VQSRLQQKKALGIFRQKMGIFGHFGQSGMDYTVKVEKTGAGLR